MDADIEQVTEAAPTAPPAVELPPEHRTRREILAVALGGLVGSVATALGRPLPVAAAAGDALKLGQANYAGTSATRLNTTSSGGAFWMTQYGFGSAVKGDSTNGHGAVFTTAHQDRYGLYAQQTGALGAGAAVRGDGGVNAGVVGTSSGSGGYGVHGSSPFEGVYGETSGDTGSGVHGYSSGQAPGVLGYAAHIGVFGQGSDVGVHGEGGLSATGVLGTSGSGKGVFGQTTSGDAVVGTSSSTGAGVRGTSQSFHGVIGTSTNQVGVYGQSSINTAVYGVSTDGPGVEGTSTNSNGVRGFGSSHAGVYGHATSADGVDGESAGQFGAGVQGTGGGTDGHGVVGGITNDSANASGVYGGSAGSTSFAGYFAGKVSVTGTLSKGGGAFRIDHPLDPANRILQHSFVESPDMLNIYNGVVTANARGEATVRLPAWFMVLNRDVRYGLTAIGSPMPDLHVSAVVRENRFSIAGARPGGQVSWQLTGIRQDAWANANRIEIELDKIGDQRGRYLHPREHGQSPSKGVDYPMQQRLRASAERR
jgi:hypothetical protein